MEAWAEGDLHVISGIGLIRKTEGGVEIASNVLKELKLMDKYYGMEV